MPDVEREELRAWIALHKRFRGLLHSGRVVRADTVHDGLQLDGVVAPDGRAALFRLLEADDLVIVHLVAEVATPLPRRG